MEKHALFPERGFRPETLREKLSHIFTARAYRAADVNNIRSSVHYRNFSTEGANQKSGDSYFFLEK